MLTAYIVPTILQSSLEKYHIHITHHFAFDHITLHNHCTFILLKLKIWMAQARIIFNQFILTHQHFLLTCINKCKQFSTCAISCWTNRTTFSVVLSTRRTQFCDRNFAVAGPRVWNSLPAPLRDTNSINSFRTQLKTHLFSGSCRTQWLFFCTLQILLLTYRNIRVR